LHSAGSSRSGSFSYSAGSSHPGDCSAASSLVHRGGSIPEAGSLLARNGAPLAARHSIDALKVFLFLSRNGVRCFYSPYSLPLAGNSDYRRVIDAALDDARHMVVVTSSRANVDSEWVQAEWGLFIKEKRSGHKTGNIMTVTTGGLEHSKLPASLRYYETLNMDTRKLEMLLPYLRG
jgi:hypothetical protein